MQLLCTIDDACVCVQVRKADEKLGLQRNKVGNQLGRFGFRLAQEDMRLQLEQPWQAHRQAVVADQPTQRIQTDSLQYPDEPGVDTWAAVVEDCLRERQLMPASA